jgi:DNA-binding CsgD family transcriptional regulator
LESALAVTDVLIAEPGLPLFMSWALSLRGAVLLAAGDVDAAAVALKDARDVAESTLNPRLIALADHHLGRVALQRGRQREAEDLLHRALALRDGAGLVLAVIESLEELACLAAGQSSHAEAVRLLAATAHHRQLKELSRPPLGDRLCEDVLERAAEALDTSTFETAVSEGAALTLGEAVAYATRARGARKRPPSGWESLTPTELDVVHHAAQGLTNPQIAEKLFISRTTVKTHLAHVFTKLGVATRTELAAEATRRLMT